MRAILCLLCMCMCLLYVKPATAQTDTLASSDLIIKFSPQHLLVNGLYLELEKRLHPGSRHSLLASPRFYYGGTVNIDSFNDRDLDLNEKNGVQGYGLALQHRIYISEGTPAIQQGMYMGYGVEYHYFRVDFEREGFVKEVDEEGLEYYRNRLRPFQEKIHRIGLVGMGGLQAAIFHDRVLADLSLGIGYRKSYIKTDYSQAIFNIGPTDFGYTGAYVLANLKFGYAF